MTSTENGKTLLLLKPRGFCAGVVRAIDIVRIALEAFGPPIYVRKEIVHNRYVVEELQAKGAVFVDSVEEVPEGERVIYSAHGVSPEVREASERRRLRVIDATCPLVTKVHVEAVRFAKDDYSIILIGHRDHDEVIGTLGEAPAVTQVISSPEEVEQLTVPDPERVAFTTQTTLSLEETKDVIAALRKRFPSIHGPAAQDICYATENRQVAVKQVAGGRGPAAGGGVGKQFELQPAGGSGAQAGNLRLPDRELPLHPSGVAGRHRHGGVDGWGFGAGVPGTRSGIVPHAVRFHQPPGSGSDARKRAFRSASGDCGNHLPRHHGCGVIDGQHRRH